MSRGSTGRLLSSLISVPDDGSEFEESSHEPMKFDDSVVMSMIGMILTTLRASLNVHVV